MCATRSIFAFLFASLCLVTGRSAYADDSSFALKPTCAEPRPAAVLPLTEKYVRMPIMLAAADALESQRIGEVLSQWEEASKDVIPPTTEDEHVAYMVHKAKSTGHEIAVALEFQSPVSVDELQKKISLAAHGAK